MFLCRGAEAKAYKLVQSDHFLYPMTMQLAQKEQHKLLNAIKSHHTIQLALLSIYLANTSKNTK